jgi:hypothetical protein
VEDSNVARLAVGLGRAILADKIKFGRLIRRVDVILPSAFRCAVTSVQLNTPGRRQILMDFMHKIYIGRRIFFAESALPANGTHTDLSIDWILDLKGTTQ